MLKSVCLGDGGVLVAPSRSRMHELVREERDTFLVFYKNMRYDPEVNIYS